nr:hydroxyacylglutathione hydrolase-like protein isoform X2 [Vicugna pacos]
MKVKVIPVLEDNYMYLVIEEHTREAVAVDVSVPKRGPRSWQRGAGETAAWAGGAGRGRAHLCTDPQAGAWRGAAVWSHPCALPPNPRPHLRPHELLPLGRRVSGPTCCFLRFALPCAHLPHLPLSPSTFSDLANSPGDALSVAGCGSRLESTAQQMYQSLVETLGTLPPETVFCGHEHTLGNLEFAQKVEPCNDHVRAKLSWAKKRDEDDVPTVPSTLGEELLYNPFLRVAEEPVRKFTGKVAPAEVLEVLCRERASFERAAEPLQPQARALLALQWGLLSTPQQK